MVVPGLADMATDGVRIEVTDTVREAAEEVPHALVAVTLMDPAVVPAVAVMLLVPEPEVIDHPEGRVQL
jgi:hypothetical protein